MKKLLWVFWAATLFLVALIAFIFYEYRLQSAFSETRQRLMSIASNAALSIDANAVLKIPLRQESESSPEYMVVFHKLEDIKKANPSVKYVYIMTATDQPGILQYVVDADPLPQVVTARCPTSFPGDKYDARGIPEMLSGYNGPSADKKITTDKWGSVISGYAPIRDASGKAVAILCVDADAVSLEAMQKGTRPAGIVALSTGLLLFISLIASFVR